MLLDCGSGTLHALARERLWWKGLSHIALTHFHTDHVADLAPILFALRHGVRPPREEPLVVLGPRGLAAHIDALVRAHGSYVREPGFPVQIVELGSGARWADPAGRFTLAAHATPHTEASLAYRVETGAGSLGYTGDTGPSDELGGFFRGVDALVAECSLANPPELAIHLGPTSLAELARASEPGLLVVTHLYPPLRPHRIPDQLRDAGYDRPLVVARDGTAVEIGAGAARVVGASGGR
jgi:ribonuclease BN (tRNA processing enzyme)